MPRRYPAHHLPDRPRPDLTVISRLPPDAWGPAAPDGAHSPQTRCPSRRRSGTPDHPAPDLTVIRRLPPRSGTSRGSRTSLSLTADVRARGPVLSRCRRRHHAHRPPSRLCGRLARFSPVFSLCQPMRVAHLPSLASGRARAYIHGRRPGPVTVRIPCHGQENTGTHGMHAWRTMNKCFKSSALK